MTTDLLLAHGRYQLHRHGWLAVIGLVLIVLALGLQLLGVDAVREQTQALRTEQAALRLRSAQKPKPDETAAKRLTEFYASLPAANAALDAVEVIHQSALKNGVKLATGEYRQLREGSTALMRYQVTLPARANYNNLRHWLDEVMNTLPTAALDEISFRRDDVASESVEARLRLTLFLRAP
jgi:hypothetical protein